MSGFEVAGIILGSIPLVISALEHYSDGVRTLKRWRSYDRELKSLIRSLNTEMVKFQNVCDARNCSPSRFEEMLSDPFGALWQDLDVTWNLQRRLWRSFKIFEDTVQDMKDEIEEMKEKLDLGPDGKVRWTESASIVRELKRATFTFKRADYQDLLTRIKEDNDNLDKLSSQNIELEQGRRGRYSGRLLGIARKFYKSIYNTLRSSIVCDCPEPHNVHLELVSHSSVPTPHDDEDMIAQDLHCRVVLSNTPNPAKIDQTAWLWNELILRLAEVPKKQAPTIKSPDLQIPRKKGGVKSVRFSTLESAHSKQMQQSNGSVTLLESATTSLAIGTAVAISSDRSDLPELVDLCAAIRHAEKQRMADCYGYIIDRSMPPSSKYEVYPVTTRIDHETWTRISLRDILKSKSKMQPQLTYTDKLRLAVAISSSVLQLQGTPWLPDILTAKDIFFIRRNDVPLYKHVFIAQPLPESGSSPSTTNPMKQTPTIWNPTILALRSLGILLIEIVCGKTLDTLRSPEDTLVANGIGDFLSDCMTARRIAAEVCQFVGYKYESAVRRCIQCDFDHPDPSFEDDRFRQDVFHGVIALLRR